ncbi:hypothetical protein FSP39_013650 [Pinctada imbricata]|uniref:Uncharacterized protein n=1 Tax=Pinctada imbricata TaxID=66713 RepID=A0AA88YBM5_PINIB|nr:hypothetical protein FSP39_013650 [Pinctada imbricata]
MGDLVQKRESPRDVFVLGGRLCSREREVDPSKEGSRVDRYVANPVKSLRMMRMDEESETMEVIEEFSPLKNSTKCNRKLTRAEKSKLAAKRRRDNEGVELDRLIELLPFSSESLKRMDKNSMMDLLLDYMKMKQYVQKEMAALSLQDKEESGETTKQVTTPTNNQVALPAGKQLALPSNGCCRNIAMINGVEVEESTLMLEAMNGFLILLDKKKRVMYASDGILTHLGIDQIYVLGKYIKDFIHPDDIAELRKQFNLKPCADQENCNCTPIVSGKRKEDSVHDPPHLDNARVFYLRMKFYLKRKNARRKHGGYTLVQWSGRLKMRSSSQPGGYAVDGLICICRPMQTNSILEINMDGNMFMSRHDLGMRFTFCDPRIVTLLGYEPQELLGKTAYTFHNPIDAPKVSDCHSKLIVKGASVSKYYRFIGKNCDWVWMQTRATIIYNTSNVPQYIVCMNYIISEEEGQRYLMMEREDKIKSQLMGVETCHGGEDHHSDSGYGSSTSPYSSIHHSPCSDHGMVDGHREQVVSQSNNGQFPTNVFQEVANTMNGTLGNEEEVAQLLKEFSQQKKDAKKSKMTIKSTGKDGQRGTQPNALKGQHNGFNQRKGSAHALLCSIPNPFSSNQQNATMRRNASTGDIKRLAHKATPVGLQQNRVSSFQQLSGLSNVAELNPLYCSQQNGSSNALSPEMNTLSPQTISDDSSEPMDMISPEPFQNAMISDVNFMAQTCQSPESISQDSVPSGGLMNVQVGLLNTMDLDTITDDLPKEITDFCIEYCESLVENQAQQIMSSLGQTDLSEFDQICSQKGFADKNFPDQPFSNTQLPSQGTFPVSCPNSFPSGSQEATVSSPTQQTSSLREGSNTGLSSLPSNYPLVPGTTLVAPVISSSTLQNMNSPQISSQNTSQQQMGCSWPNSPLGLPGQSVQDNSISSSPMMSQPSPGSCYSYPQPSPQSISALSPASSATSTFSPRPSPQSPGVYPPSPGNGFMSHSSSRDTSMNFLPRSQQCNQTFSCNDCMSPPSMTASSYNGRKNQLMRTYSAPTTSTLSSANNDRVNMPVNSNCFLTANSQGTRMSELEKMLRGYSRNNDGSPVTQTLCGEKEANNCSHSKLLQQMLTGQLSGEVYHAMENKRKVNVLHKPLH